MGETIGALQQSASGIEALRYSANGLYTSLDRTFTTLGGAQVPRLDQLYRKYGAIHNGSRNFQAVTDDVGSRRENLRGQIAETTARLQASTTDAETQKLTGVLVGYNAELATVDHEIDQAAAQVATQDAENRADRERQDGARREERQAQMEESLHRYGEASVWKQRHRHFQPTAEANTQLTRRPMNDFNTLFPNFLTQCAEMNRVLTPIAFVLLAIGVVSSTVTGRRSPSAYLRTVGRTFAFAAVLAYFPLRATIRNHPQARSMSGGSLGRVVRLLAGDTVDSDYRDSCRCRTAHGRSRARSDVATKFCATCRLPSDGRCGNSTNGRVG